MAVEKTKYYAYFFTRQDLSYEQQLVQTAHVALKLGFNASNCVYDEATDEVPFRGKDLDPSGTYFTVVGVRNLEALEGVARILDKFEYAYEVFREPDMNDDITAIAVYPVAEYNRGPLLAFNLLRMTKST